MKKITLLSAATAAAFALAPVAANAATPPGVNLVVKPTSSTAGTKKKPKTVGFTVSTGVTGDTGDAKTKHTVTHAKIWMSKGIKLNYKAFPECDIPDEALSVNEDWCAANAPKSKIGSGNASADVVDAGSPEGTLIPYIGSNNRLLVQTQFNSPAVIDQPLVGKVATASGDYSYSFDFTVQSVLQEPVVGGFVQLKEFNLKFDKKTAKVSSKKKVGLVDLVSCPKGGYKFKAEFTFRDGQTATKETVVKCKQGK